MQTMPVQILASYELFGDDTNESFVAGTLMAAKIRGDIESFKVHQIILGYFNIRIMVFEITMNIDPFDGHKKVEADAKALLEKTFNDEVTIIGSGLKMEF